MGAVCQGSTCFTLGTCYVLRLSCVSDAQCNKGAQKVVHTREGVGDDDRQAPITGACVRWRDLVWDYGIALRQWHHRVEEHDEGRASKGVLRGGYKHTGA